MRNYRLEPRFSDLPFLHVAAAAIARCGGPERLWRSGIRGVWSALQAIERLNLDGLLALWHPSPELKWYRHVLVPETFGAERGA